MFRFAGRLPTRQNSSPATNVGWFVRQAAKDGSLPAKRNIKKQSPFFPWVRTHIHRRSGRKEKAGRKAERDPAADAFFPGVISEFT